MVLTGLAAGTFALLLSARKVQAPHLARNDPHRRGERRCRPGPTRGIAVCRAPLFLAANRARKWDRPG